MSRTRKQSGDGRQSAGFQTAKGKRSNVPTKLLFEWQEPVEYALKLHAERKAQPRWWSMPVFVILMTAATFLKAVVRFPGRMRNVLPILFRPLRLVGYSPSEIHRMVSDAVAGSTQPALTYAQIGRFCLFFLVLSSVFYLGAWGLARVLSRFPALSKPNVRVYLFYWGLSFSDHRARQGRPIKYSDIATFKWRFEADGVVLNLSLKGGHKNREVVIGVPDKRAVQRITEILAPRVLMLGSNLPPAKFV